MDEMSSQQQALLDAFQNQRNGDEDEDDDDEDLDEFRLRTRRATSPRRAPAQVIADLVAQHVEAQLAPRDYEEGILARDEDFEALREEDPRLQNDEVAAVVINARRRVGQPQRPRDHRPARLRGPDRETPTRR